MFASGGVSGFYLGAGQSTVISYGFDSTRTANTIIWSGGATATLQGGTFETRAITTYFTNYNSTTNTGNFGIAKAIPTFS